MRPRLQRQFFAVVLLAAGISAAVLVPRWLEIGRLQGLQGPRPAPALLRENQAAIPADPVLEARWKFAAHSSQKTGTAGLAALEALTKIPAAERGRAMSALLAIQPEAAGLAMARLLFQHWVSDNAPEAFAWVSGNVSGQAIISIVSAGVGPWLQQDRPACLAWLLSFGLRKQERMNYLGEALLWVDPSAFAEFWAVAEKSLINQVTFQSDGMTCTLGSGVQARRFYEAVLDSGMHQADSFLQVVGGRWVDIDPDSAAQWLAEHPDTSHSPILAKQLGVKLMQQAADPAAGADAWLAVPAGISREALFQTVMEQWPASAPDKALSWLTSRSAGADIHAALTALGCKTVAADPAGAFLWLDTINDQTVREQSFAAVYDAWLAKDAAAASAFTPPADWPPERVRRFRALQAIPKSLESSP